MARFAKAKRLALEEQIRPLIEQEKWQQWKVAERLGISADFVERACKRLGLQTQRTGPRSGERHPNWKGGRIQVGRYWYRYYPEHPNATRNGYMLEHRLVMEGVLTRLLTRTEVVHHVDGNPQNNDPQNLQVFETNAKHLQHELQGRLPNWTDAGLARMEEALKRRSNLHLSISDGGPHTLESVHQTGVVDSSDAAQACEKAP